MGEIALTAIVTAFPPGLRRPKPLPGETLAQLVIRNHPQQWRNCVERLKHDFNASEEMCSRLLRGELSAAVDPVAQREIQRFMNLRLPSHGRTLQGLADLREQMQEPGLGQLWQLRLSEIIWPRQKDPSGERESEQFAASLGVMLVSIETDEPRPLELGKLLKYVHGDYVWILPGGSRLAGPMTIFSLIRVLRGFQEDPKLAMYSDQCYCIIYRTSALHALMAAGKTISPEVRDTARMLKEAGFELAADNDPIHGLVEIESLYGGQHNSPRIGWTSWWQNLFRLD